MTETMGSLMERYDTSETEAVHAEDMGVGEFLEHFGIKGMKWGKMTGGRDGVGPGASGSGGGDKPQSARQRNRELNRASKEKDRTEKFNNKAQNKKDILDARDRVFNGENKDKLDAAKEKYKQDKVAVGSREARKALNKVRDDAWADVAKANEYLDGKEFAKDLLTSLATVPLGRVGELIDATSRQNTIKKSVRQKS